MDLKSSAESFDKLMANGNGHFDFSGRLENLKAGIINLWAVNVIAAIVSKEDEYASKINCVVGRWTMKDGLLTPEVFLIDASKIPCDIHLEHVLLPELNFWQSPANPSATRWRTRDALCRWV